MGKIKKEWDNLFPVDTMNKPWAGAMILWDILKNIETDIDPAPIVSYTPGNNSMSVDWLPTKPGKEFNVFSITIYESGNMYWVCSVRKLDNSGIYRKSGDDFDGCMSTLNLVLGEL